jgi:hypothetical protein
MSRISLALAGLLLGGLAILILFRLLYAPHGRLYGHEAVALAKLRSVVVLQNGYAKTHAAEGFTCELHLLKPLEARGDAEYDPLRFFTTGTDSGYKYTLANCRADAKGVFVQYQLTAVPIEQGRTGLHAFCTDESGVLWYARRVLPQIAYPTGTYFSNKCFSWRKIAYHDESRTIGRINPSPHPFTQSID